MSALAVALDTDRRCKLGKKSSCRLAVVQRRLLGMSRPANWTPSPLTPLKLSSFASPHSYLFLPNSYPSHSPFAIHSAFLFTLSAPPLPLYSLPVPLFSLSQFPFLLPLDPFFVSYSPYGYQDFGGNGNAEWQIRIVEVLIIYS